MGLMRNNVLRSVRKLQKKIPSRGKGFVESAFNSGRLKKKNTPLLKQPPGGGVAQPRDLHGGGVWCWVS